MSLRYAKSEAFLSRAEKVIPLGSQTFSKSKTQYPYGVSPYFATRSNGCHLWDLDGNCYIDCVMSLAAVTLGYNDKDVTQSVLEQLQKGTIFTLPSPLETEVAEMICEMVPCAEMVRFGKNGSDATAGAIRVARAYTGRDHVAVCGYHGWQDWYIGSTTRNKGVPQVVQGLTHKFTYNDLSSLDEIFENYPNQIAAVILEPMNVQYPNPGFLEGVQGRCKKNGAVLILDETITGFRFSKGGAQEIFGITPDLACFGKGIANGYPLSVVVGRKELMKEMEEIFFSFTFGGETLSLAASLATLKKIQEHPVIETIFQRGEKLQNRLQELIARHNLQDVLRLSGHPTWPFLIIKDAPNYSQWIIKTYMMQELQRRGILWLGTFNLSYAHEEEDIEKLIQIFDEVLSLLSQHLTEGNLTQRLECEPIQPLFKVR